MVWLEGWSMDAKTPRQPINELASLLVTTLLLCCVVSLCISFRVPCSPRLVVGKMVYRAVQLAIIGIVSMSLYIHPKMLNGDFVYDDGGTITGNNTYSSSSSSSSTNLTQKNKYINIVIIIIIIISRMSVISRQSCHSWSASLQLGLAKRLLGQGRHMDQGVSQVLSSHHQHHFQMECYVCH
jgi:hypothetical protein